MKTTSKLLLLVLSFIVTLSSCTMEKRLYTSGYHIDWHKTSPNPASKPARAEQSIAPDATVQSNQEERNILPVANTASPSFDQNNTFSASTADEITVLSPTKIQPAVSSGVTRSEAKKEMKAIVKQAVKKAKAEKANPMAPAGGDKSWLAALLICIFLGGIGIHRFYLGYTWQGVVQLLTLGGCGVWALIDLIRIIMRDLKPKDGDYTD